MNKHFKRSFVAIAVLGASTSALAIDPAAVELGGVNLFPTLSITTGHDDNPFSQTTANPEDSVVSVINPNLLFLAQDNDDVYSLGIDIARGIFHDSTDDNYTDVSVDAVADLVLNSKNALVLSAGYLDGHEDRGTGSTQGVSEFISGSIELNSTTASLAYTYGAATAKARIQFLADYYSLSFDDLLSINANRERSDKSVAARLLYAVGADTDLTLEARASVIDYDNQAVVKRDSNEMEYFVGLEWQATAKTSGYAKIGIGDKEFDSVFDGDGDLRQDPGTEVSWDVGVVWEPRTYSAVTLSTSREEDETPSTGAYIDRTAYGVSWNHAWSEQLSTNIGYNFLNQEYVGSLQDDDIDSFTAGLTYGFARWMDIGLTYDYSDKASTVDGLAFDRNKIMLSLTLSL